MSIDVFDKSGIVLIIPALNPDQKLLGVVRELQQSGFSKLLIVNDGSRPECQAIFEELAGGGCQILTHHKNMGKGRALKNALNAALSLYPDCTAAVTLDADGQHLTKDVIRVAEEALLHPDSIILGSREFGKDVPARSKFGNVMTRNVMALFCGLKLRDTQTGLRGFSRSLIPNFLTTAGERYEYELNVLLAAKEQNIPVKEITIETVYIDENSSSHFNPFKDSIRIYSMFLKYIAASLFSFVLDISLFALFALWFKNVTYAAYVYIATALARAVSSFANYLINRRRVFKSTNTTRRETTLQLVGYYILVVCNVIVSALAVNLLSKALGWNETLAKLPVDTVLFLCNYVIQREWIFRSHKEAK